MKSIEQIIAEPTKYKKDFEFLEHVKEIVHASTVCSAEDIYEAVHSAAGIDDFYPFVL